MTFLLHSPLVPLLPFLIFSSSSSHSSFNFTSLFLLSPFFFIVSSLSFSSICFLYFYLYLFFSQRFIPLISTSFISVSLPLPLFRIPLPPLISPYLPILTLHPSLSLSHLSPTSFHFLYLSSSLLSHVFPLFRVCLPMSPTTFCLSYTFLSFCPMLSSFLYFTLLLSYLSRSFLLSDVLPLFLICFPFVSYYVMLPLPFLSFFHPLSSSSCSVSSFFPLLFPILTCLSSLSHFCFSFSPTPSCLSYPFLSFTLLSCFSYSMADFYLFSSVLFSRIFPFLSPFPLSAYLLMHLLTLPVFLYSPLLFILLHTASFIYLSYAFHFPNVLLLFPILSSFLSVSITPFQPFPFLFLLLSSFSYPMPLVSYLSSFLFLFHVFPVFHTLPFPFLPLPYVSLTLPFPPSLCTLFNSMILLSYLSFSFLLSYAFPLFLISASPLLSLP